MSTNVVMPQMGESVAEGTVVRWIKKVGERIDRDEPLFEISTDKVDAEIPSPAAGVLTEIRVKEGETVPVESIVAIISGAEEAASASAPATAVTADAPARSPGNALVPEAKTTTVPAAAAGERETRTPPAEPMPQAQMTDEETRDHLRRTRSSPLVRRIAEEHHVDISKVPGSGIGGRVTKQDILRHLEAEPSGEAPAAEPTEISYPSSESPAFKSGERVEVVPMSLMRRKIAEHMVLSRRTSAHVHSVFDVDFHRIAQIREQKKAEYERRGSNLTYLAFIAKAVCQALREVPVVNASIDGDNIVYKQDINLGIAVAMDRGLIVPVVRNADEKNLLGLSRSIADLANRARAKQLKNEEVHGGTFTITNPGTFGTLFGMPIINQPQVAILAVGVIEKRVVVIDDAIHIRPRAYLCLGYDHRLVDGAVADEFMSHVKHGIENFDPAAV